MNVLDQLPRTRQAEARRLLTKIPYASTREEAERQKQAFQAWCAERGLAEVGRRLDRDWEWTFYQFPHQHWKHLKTTNPVESPFAAVRHLRRNFIRELAARRRAGNHPVERSAGTPHATFVRGTEASS